MSKGSDVVQWDRLPVFQAVAEAGSFTKAGRKLDLSQSAVSRQICALEASLTVPLFYRHARGLVLTEQGEAFFRVVKEMEAQLAQAISRIAESRVQPEGPLKITTTVTFGSAWLAALLALLPALLVERFLLAPLWNFAFRFQGQPSSPLPAHAQAVADLLKRSEKNKRPRKRTTLHNFVATHFQKKLTAEEVKQAVEHLVEVGISTSMEEGNDPSSMVEALPNH